MLTARGHRKQRWKRPIRSFSPFPGEEGQIIFHSAWSSLAFNYSSKGFSPLQNFSRTCILSSWFLLSWMYQPGMNRSQNQLCGWPQKYFVLTIRPVCLRANFLFSVSEFQNHFLGNSSLCPSLPYLHTFHLASFYSDSQQELRLCRRIPLKQKSCQFPTVTDHRVLAQCYPVQIPKTGLNEWMKGKNSRDSGRKWGGDSKSQIRWEKGVHEPNWSWRRVCIKEDLLLRKGNYNIFAWRWNDSLERRKTEDAGKDGLSTRAMFLFR